MASGRPDWYGSMTLHGRYTVAGVDSYKSIAVDEEGNLITLMTGVLEGVYTPIAVDDEGIMRANLVLQELPFMTVRPAYGSAVRSMANNTVPDSVQHPVFDLDRQGIIYDGYFYAANCPLNATWITMIVDGVVMCHLRPLDLWTRQVLGGYNFRLTLTRYIVATNTFAILIASPITFEDTFVLQLRQESGVDKSIYHNVTYALTPERE